MADRHRLWVGAGIIAGAISASALAGAGIATADDAATSGVDNDVSAGSRDTLGPGPGAAAASPTSSAGEPENTSGKAQGRQQAESEPADSEPPADSGNGQNRPDGGDRLPATGAVSSGSAADSGDEPEDGQLGPETPAPSDPSAAADGEAIPEQSQPVVAQSPEAPEAPGTQSLLLPPGGRHRAPEPADNPAASVSDAAATVDVTAVEQPDGPDPNASADAPSDSQAAVVQDIAVRDEPQTSPAPPVMMRAATAAAPRKAAGGFEGFLDDVGTLLYNLYTNTVLLIAGPARVPSGSRVTVASSSLEIAEGTRVSADWYFPRNAQPATGLIYLQHGFLATSALYSATAAYLAEHTNSIVVAPTLTWNAFDSDGYPLMLSRTREAIADLFVGDRSALHDSARSAGYTATLPRPVVLAGHSAGGGMVVGSAARMAENGTLADLKGVVMLDGVGFLDGLGKDLARVPRTIPVYNLAAEPSRWNTFGDASRTLQAMRPGTFNGVMLDNGAHTDSLQTHNPMIQFTTYMLMGFPVSVNVTAARMVTTGWINDLFAGTRTAGFYTDPADGPGGWWRLPTDVDSLPTFSSQFNVLNRIQACFANPLSISCTQVVPQMVAST
jgi:hypothetical protein